MVAIFQAVAVWTGTPNRPAPAATRRSPARWPSSTSSATSSRPAMASPRRARHGASAARLLRQRTGARLRLRLAPGRIAASAGGAPDRDQRPVRRLVLLRRGASFNDSSAHQEAAQRRAAFKPGDLAVVAVNAAASAASASSSSSSHRRRRSRRGTPSNITVCCLPKLLLSPCRPRRSRRASTARPAPVVLIGNDVQPRPEPTTGRVGHPGQPHVDAHRPCPRRDADADRRRRRQPEGGIRHRQRTATEKTVTGRWTAFGRRADWRRLQAVRVAVLVRSRQYELHGDPGASGVRAVTPDAARPFYFGDPVNRRFRMTDPGTATPIRFNDAHRRSEQLALLPLPRLRARDPAAQHAVGDQTE